MTPLPELRDRLRAALRETADEIPAETPPLRLSPGPPAGNGGRDPRRWTAWGPWTAPLAAAALVVAVIAATVTIAGGLKPRPSDQASLDGLPPYYVALTTKEKNSDIYPLGATAAEVRSTLTGAVLAKVAPPRPYVTFTGVTGATDDRTFVLSAQGPDKPPNLPEREYFKKYPHGWYPAQRFFLLRIDPPGGRMSLTALSAGSTPPNSAIHDMALSPDGTALAADVGGALVDNHLYVFDLATGTERAWSARTCSRCFPYSGGLGYGGVNVDALSWTADSRHVAFVWGNTVRLLDTRAPGSDILADSKTVAVWTTGQTRAALDMWRGAIITPDGRTVLGIEEIGPPGIESIPEHLVRFSTATGRQTAIVNNLDVLKLNGYEQILYTNPTGSVLVVTNVTYVRPGRSATIVHDGRSTPIPWSPYIGIAAW